ncbi:ALMS1 centrosome and basal body associated protein [Salmo trutta]|uniref:Alstrom syndrome protein 1 n=1 Tax=Salmo trutta TaxID=8032 RepID=UPI00112FDD59|nr:Alstrom syndrome protein 1 [Salmo trutta]
MYGQMSRSHPDVGPPGSIVGSGADWVSGAWTSRTGHVSHLHLTLSPGPKGAEERSRRLLSFAPVRHSSAVSSSVDVDESPSYAPEPSPANQTGSQENRDPIWRQGRETADASVQITTGTSTATSTFPQCFTPPQRLTGTGPSRQAALSVLLPYKPHGSEMFYVSQTHPDPQLSPVRSDSIGESTHPGSDDAVPPRFNIEILGSREQQVDQVVDRGVNIKHTEGIYSKRLRLGENYSMERTGTTVPLDEGQPMIDQHAPQSEFFSHVTGGLTRGPAIPTTTTRGPAVPSTTTRGPAIPTITTRGPAIPTTTTRGPAIPTTTTRGPAIPTITTRGPAIPTTTTRGPAIPTTTTRGPAIPSTTTRGPAIPSTTTRGPAIPTTTTRGPSGATRDHGTSITTSTHTQGVPDTDRPVQPSLRCSLGVGEEELEVFQPLHVEMDYSSMDLHHHFPKTHPTHHLRMDHQISNTHLVRTSAPHPGMEREPGRRDHSLARRSGSTLDQLWRRFSERWSLEEARPTNEREASLLERLERLSRLIHSTGTSAPPEPEPRQQTDTTEQDGGGRRRERKSSRKEEERRREGVEEERSRREKSNSGRSDPDAKANQAKASVPRRAWEQQDEEPQPAEGEDCSASYSSSPSHRPARSQYLCPAERESSGSISGETSSSMSTIDTARLVRAFGAHRVRGLNTGGTSSSHRTSHSLSKLYSTILQQRQSKEQRRGRSRETPHIPPVPSESTGTDDSVIPADSASSTSTLPSHRGPSHSKKAVKHVSKGVQAGDLEIVSNGTRRHTRDVGTTFPSPGSARGARVLPSSHSGSKRVRAGDRSPPKTQRKRKMSQPFAKPYYPQGVSWYIPAEDLRAEGRKENNPEQQPTRGPAWFEPYSRTTRPWREPLRQRQIQDRERLTDRLQTNQLEADRDRPNERQHIKHSIITPPGPEPTGNTPAALVRISLQEALELRRPEFVSRSRERVKRLLLQVEERKLQVVFSRERNELFNQPRRPGRLAQPAAVFQRAVPKKELVQRSKQQEQEQEADSNNRGARRKRRMYEQLPEVQRRREEEKRREEYRSYRLNAQLYNKRITNRVLGRQTPWQ